MKHRMLRVNELLKRELSGIVAREIAVEGFCTGPGKNVLGMMPHPDRSSDPLLGSTDGKVIFESMVNALTAK